MTVPRPEWQLRRRNGFTLLEILVVLAIIGITLSLAVINLGDDRLDRQLDEEGRRLKALITLASEQAILQNREIALAVTTSQYQFLTLAEKKWQPIAGDRILRLRTLKPGQKLSLDLENRPVILPDSPDSPQVFLLSSGEISPFLISLTDEALDSVYRLSPGSDGQLNLDLEHRP